MTPIIKGGWNNKNDRKTYLRASCGREEEGEGGGWLISGKTTNGKVVGNTKSKHFVITAF